MKDLETQIFELFSKEGFLATCLFAGGSFSPRAFASGCLEDPELINTALSWAKTRSNLAKFDVFVHEDFFSCFLNQQGEKEEFWIMKRVFERMCYVNKPLESWL